MLPKRDLEATLTPKKPIGDGFSVMLGSVNLSLDVNKSSTFGHFLIALRAPTSTKRLVVGAERISASFTLDSHGFPLMTYQSGDSQFASLKLTRCYDANCTSLLTTRLHPISTVGCFHTLCLDGNNFPVITYNGNRTLKLIRCSRDVGCMSPKSKFLDCIKQVGEPGSVKQGENRASVAFHSSFLWFSGGLFVLVGVGIYLRVWEQKQIQCVRELLLDGKREEAKKRGMVLFCFNFKQFEEELKQAKAQARKMLLQGNIGLIQIHRMTSIPIEILQRWSKWIRYLEDKREFIFGEDVSEIEGYGYESEEGA